MVATQQAPPSHSTVIPDPPISTAPAHPNAKVQEKALLVTLGVKRWGVVVHDKDVTQDVADMKNADAEQSGKFMKRLLPSDSTKRINQAATAIRKHHYYYTTPWDDSGTRILPCSVYDVYDDKLQELVMEFEDARNELLNNFKEHLDQAQLTLGKMFRANDYPTTADLMDAYQITCEYGMIPDPDDFHVNLGQKENALLTNQVRQTIENRLNNSVHSLYQRLHEVVEHAIGRLELAEEGDDSDDDDGESKPKRKVFRDTMLKNLRSVFEVLPDLNVTNDPLLNELVEQGMAAFEDVNVNELREGHKDFDEDKHKNVTDALADMRERMSGYFGG